ncbi:MAG: adenosylmethionine--8-amino-7-oxononanoate transaminase, partial [Pirellulaceae bacterium]|nr:adenosylmethionine--8-amino-7-oxononanoate transaminase [Pirellulaceae bacterium]
MPSREQLLEWDRRHVWHAFTQMAEYEPFIVERASGCRLFDIDGASYLDAVSSLWCNVHGHQHPIIDRAIREQLSRVSHVTSLGASNPTTIELAKRLCDLAPAGLEHVFFSGDGSSGVEVALKQALQYWRQRPSPRPEKTKYIALGEAYHGDTIGSVSVGGVARFHSMFEPLLFEVVRGPLPDTFRLPAGVAAGRACEHYLEQIERLLIAHGPRTAALVIEPLVQCAAGMVMHPAGFLAGVRELTRRHEVLMIADEVAVGFGRTGKMFACEHEGVEPDFLCLGKGLTGGYLAMAATLTTTEVWDAFLGDYAESKSFFHGHTFGGNPLAAAAANACLDVFEQERTLAKLPEKCAQLNKALDPLREHPRVGDVRQRGLLAAVELVQDKSTRTPFPWEQRRGAA